MIEHFLETKRKEYKWAVKHDLKTLQRVILEGVKKVIKYHNYKPKEAEQLKLF